MARFLTLISILLAAVVAYVAAIFAADRVETMTHDDVTAVLAAEGHDWAEVAVDGLTVELTGQARDEATRFAAVTAAGTIVGGERVTDAMTVTAPDPSAPPPFSVEILRSADGVSLIGLIPASTSSTEIAEAARRAAGDARVVDLLETADYREPDGWETALNFGLEVLATLDSAKISITADRVAISAVTTSPAEKRRVEAQLNQDTPRGVALALDISAPRPVIAPFTLRFVRTSDGARFDACAADTEAARDAIVAAALEAGLDSDPACVLGLGTPSTRWSTAAVAGIEAVGTIGSGTVTLSNADVTLIVPQGTDPRQFERAVSDLEAALPEVFSLTAVLPEPEKTDAASDAAPEFVATYSPEGILQLRGRLADEVSRDAVHAFAAASFGAEQLVPGTRIDEALPTGWSLRVLAALEALSTLNNGVAVVQEDLIDISGYTGSQSASADVARILSDKLPDGAEFAIDVTYSEALDPEAALPSPQECVDRITAAKDDGSLTFAPSSTELEASAASTIAAIADVLRTCQHVPMEIGGHTDSQGREVMNQQLSQARADAVLNAIMARRVLTQNLTARGYGESRPIADNDTEAGREANRRIEFRLASDVAAEAEPDAAEGDGEGEDTPPEETDE